MAVTVKLPTQLRDATGGASGVVVSKSGTGIAGRLDGMGRCLRRRCS